jgi:hypothetical protein
LSHRGHTARAAWLWSVTPRLTGELVYQEQEVLANFANIQGRQPDLVTTRLAYANGAWMATPSWRLHAVLSAGQTEHQDPVRSAFDLETGAAELGWSYVTPSENRIGVAVRSERGRAPRSTTLFGAPIDNAYQQDSFGAQARWVLTGLSRLDGRIDWTSRRYDQLTQRNYSGPTFRATYTYTPTGKLTIAAIAQRDSAPLEDLSASFVLVSSIAVRPDWAVTDKINVRGNLAYSEWDYRGDAALGLEYTHRVRTGGLSILYRPTAHITLSGGISREKRTSTAAFGDYEVTVGFIEGRFGF